MNEKINNIIKKLDDESKTCDTIDKHVDFAYSFRYEDISIIPFQIKNEIIILLNILRNFSPKIIVEIGTANGGTLYLLTKTAAKNAKIISIDLPDGHFGGEAFPEWKDKFYESFATHDQKIYILRSDSHDNSTITNVKNIIGEEKIDFLLIDGDHTFNGVKKDFELYKSLMNSDGIIAFHDISRGLQEHEVQVNKFWNEIKSQFPSVEIIDNNNTRHYGLGLIFPNMDEQNPKYIQIMKIIINTKNLLSINDNQIFFEELEAMSKKTPLLQKILNHKNSQLQYKINYLNDLNLEIQHYKIALNNKDIELQEKSDQLDIIKKSRIFNIFLHLVRTIDKIKSIYS